MEVVELKQELELLLLVISGAGSFASNKVTYDNNTSTSARSTVIRATMDSVTKDTTVTQNAGSKTYSSWGAWLLV